MIADRVRSIRLIQLAELKVRLARGRPRQRRSGSLPPVSCPNGGRCIWLPNGRLAGQLSGTTEPARILTAPATAEDDGDLAGREMADLELDAGRTETTDGRGSAVRSSIARDLSGRTCSRSENE